jgi:hypothetical protein
MENQKQTDNTELDGKLTIARLGRMFVFFLTAGFMYPNVFVEGIDPTRIQGETLGDLYKKK